MQNKTKEIVILFKRQNYKKLFSKSPGVQKLSIYVQCILCWMFSNVPKKKLRVPRKMCKLRPGTQVPLFFHSSQPHLNVWLKAVKSWPRKRDEKGTKEDRKKVWWWCFDSVKLYSEAATNCTENLSVLLQNFLFFESIEQYL